MTTANWSIRVRRGEIEIEVAGVTQKVQEPEELLEKVVKKYAPEWVKVTRSP